MIEITRAPEESRENLRKIPRNIRQIGNTTGYGKIYMEDMVYQFLSEGGIEEGQHLTTYLLLGEDFYQKEEQYLFIRGALELENMTYSRDFPVFSEEIWNDIYKGMRKYFQDEKILGWAINRKGGRLDYCGEMETICRRHFHGENQMVLFFDTADDAACPAEKTGDETSPAAGAGGERGGGSRWDRIFCGCRGRIFGI